jgi:hypothetical protein
MTRTIPLTKGQTALIDDADFYFLNQWKWHYTRKGYAARTKTIDGKRTTIFMHRMLMAAQPGQFVDHKDGNRLNNTRSNLRFATRNENQWNRKKQVNSSSGYKGVSRHHGRWQARIRVNGRRIHLGYYDDPKTAAQIYDAAAKRYFGTFANTNRPKEWNIPAHLNARLDEVLTGNRPRTKRQAPAKRQPLPKRKSVFRGVYWERGRWRATIADGGRKAHLGYFWDEVQAALAYDEAALQLRGPHALLNFPLEADTGAVAAPFTVTTAATRA